MARRSISVLGCVFRNLTSCSENYVTNPFRHCVHLRHACLSSTVKRYCASTQFKTDLHEVLDNRDVDGLLEMMDETRDVYTRGFLLSTPKEDIQTFFEGAEIDDIHTLHSSKTNTKVFHYIRFKDAASKELGISKHRQEQPQESRYIEVFDVKDFEKLGCFFLADRSNLVVLKNLSYDVTNEHIAKWLKDLSLDARRVNFIDRGSCIVELDSPELVNEAVKFSSEKMLGRSIYMKAYLRGTAIYDLRKKLKDFHS